MYIYYTICIAIYYIYELFVSHGAYFSRVSQLSDFMAICILYIYIEYVFRLFFHFYMFAKQNRNSILNTIRLSNLFEVNNFLKNTKDFFF